jgi:8-oxo-dGTP pyrophosphatase MutT (NUDIX family)
MRSLFSSRVPSQQSAALPLLELADGTTLVGLVTTRETGSWVVPKGWIKPGLPARKSAAREAVQEAGLEGLIAQDPIGSYSYRKRLHLLASVECVVEVYALQVTAQLVDWPEKGQREVVFLSPREAAIRVREPELAELILAATLPPRL